MILPTMQRSPTLNVSMNKQILLLRKQEDSGSNKKAGQTLNRQEVDIQSLKTVHLGPDLCRDMKYYMLTSLLFNASH